VTDRDFLRDHYYLARPEKFLQEAHRVLRDGGILLIATVNKDWPEFNPRPFSTRYFSVPELGKLLEDNGFNAEFYGAFSALPKGLKEKTVALIKRIAVSFHLIPKTMKGKEFLKRIFFGKLLVVHNCVGTEAKSLLPVRRQSPNPLRNHLQCGYGRRRLPFPKGGIVPLFGKEGLGEISRKICLLNYGLLSNCCSNTVMGAIWRYTGTACARYSI
jgi:hypothetical protein